MASKLRLLIIGASGFLGSKLFLDLTTCQDIVVFGSYYKHPYPKFVYLDATNYEQVRATIKNISPDVIVDCSGITRPDKCEIEKQLSYRVNVTGVENMLQAHSCKYIYFSTDYVFDGSKGDYIESDNARPINYYGFTKLEAEKIVLAHKKGNVVIRVSGLYGFNSINNEFISGLIGQDIIYKPIDVFSSNLFLDDLKPNLINIIQSQEGIFHIASEERISRFDFCAKSIQKLEITAKIIGKPAREIYKIAQRPQNSSLFSTREKFQVCDSEQGLKQTKKQYEKSL